MLANLLLFCILVSLFTTGLYVAIQWPGMILHGLKDAFDYAIPYEFARKPFYDCLICMSSFWSIVLWLPLCGFWTWQTLIAIPVVAGINTLISILLQNFTDYGS